MGVRVPPGALPSLPEEGAQFHPPVAGARPRRGEREGEDEGSADERIAKAQRIARANDELRRAGEISDGSGKPAFHRVRRSAPWIAIGAVVAAAIVVIALIAR